MFSLSAVLPAALPDALAASPRVLAQTSANSDENLNFWDNDILNQWRIPFGDWMEVIVFWIVNNAQPVLDVIEWPFRILIREIVGGGTGGGHKASQLGLALTEIYWVWVVLLVAAIALLTRNFRVGLAVTGALVVCGLLGHDYWLETARTIGFIGVAVLLCAVIGIPVGIACARFEGVWVAVRPVLDAMQVVHSFAYMLPFIFFWGIGEVPATMVTMVFALPPLIRLTNLGIRQVPAETVEAARAYGAPDWRVLLDVQLPLARRTIMAGLNQTLLLSISMLGIAAIMGAGGLGRLLFQAISNQDLALAASAGLAFFMVAVVLDRVSQRTDSDPANLLVRIGRAWQARRHPERLLAGAAATPALAAPQHQTTNWGSPAPIAIKEHLPMLWTIIGGVLLAGGALLPWTTNAGKLSAYGRLADTSPDASLDGMNFLGISASGGSWFGILALVLGGFIVLAVGLSFSLDYRIPRWFAADGAAIAAIAAVILLLAHILARPLGEFAGQAVPHPGHGPGVFLALIGAALAAIGAIGWMLIGDYTPRRPLKVSVSWGRLLSVGLALGLLVIALYASWLVDERHQGLSPETQAQIADLEQRAKEPGANVYQLSQEILTLSTRTIEGERIIDGLSQDGPQLGLWLFVFGLLAAFAAVPAVGLYGTKDRLLWHWNSITAGLGSGICLVGVGWILTHVRSSDYGFITGPGSFLAALAGAIIIAATLPVLNLVRRTPRYPDADTLETPPTQPIATHSPITPATATHSPAIKSIP